MTEPIRTERRNLWSRKVFRFYLVVRVPGYKKPRKESLRVIRAFEMGHTDGEKVTRV